MAAAVKEKKPSVRIYGVQTEAAPAMAHSFRAGEIVHHAVERSLADGIAVKRPGELTFEHIRHYVDGICTVSEDEIRGAIIRLLETGKTSTEGAAAATLAALTRHRIPAAAGRNVVMILSGANIDPLLLLRVIRFGMTSAGRYFSFRTRLRDRPGELQRLSGAIAQVGVNVVGIEHRREGVLHSSLGDVEVSIQVELRGPDHIKELIARLEDDGYEVIAL